LSGEPVLAHDWMIVAANPHAADAGAEVLRTGGTAADAMIAVQTVLGLVEPQSSGIGGGAFLIWYDGASGEITTLDGRETAPKAVTPRHFQTDDGVPIKFWDAVVGGKSVGVPGTPALMEMAHKKWGRKQWASLFKQAIRLAEDGFPVSQRLAELVANDTARLSRFFDTRAYFLPGGVPVAEGSRLFNHEYANVMRQMAERGASVIYSGEIADAIVKKVQTAENNPGVLSLADLSGYEVKERPALCSNFRQYSVCGMGPPSSGALAIGQILGMISQYPVGKPYDAQTLRLIGDASRLAFADRGRYVADSDFVPVPMEGLIAEDYLSERASLLSRANALRDVEPGKPQFSHALIWAEDKSLEFPSTSHISIVDVYGNALSMTTTIENAFGSRLMTHGFLLNNELTDFSFKSHHNGVPVANRIQPGKRPRSSMSPTIVLQDNLPVLVIGSPGGSRIIGYVVQAIIAHLDWGMHIQEAVSMPHAVNRFGTYDLEQGTDLEGLLGPLQSLGYRVRTTALNSGLHAISVEPNILRGGADPRREGIAIGK